MITQNTNSERKTLDDFSNYLDDIFNNKYQNIFEHYNIAKFRGIVSDKSKVLQNSLSILKKKSSEFEKLANSEPNEFFSIMILITNNNASNYLKIFRATKFNVWDILFKINEKPHHIVFSDLIKYLDFIDLNIDEINTVYNLKDYVNKNKYNVEAQIHKILNQNHYDWNYFENKKMVNTIHKIVKKSFNLSLWEKFIYYCIKENYIKIIKTSFIEDKWVFANIQPTLIHEAFGERLNEQLESFKFKYDCDKVNFKDFCANSVTILNIFLEISKINNSFKVHFILFLKNNINKIVILHNNTNTLEKIKLINSSLFREVDDSGYHPFTDLIRYGEFQSIKWFFNNILTDLDLVTSAFHNCFIINIGMCYLLENTDYRIIDLVFNYFEIYPTLLNIDNILYIPNTDDIKSIPSFSKKIRALFDFIVRNDKYYLLNQNNFVKDSLLNYESRIENKNFQPFILPTLYSLNKKYNIQICLNSALLYNTIHRKYFNKENILKLIELGHLNNETISISKRKTFLCKIIKINLFSQSKSSSLTCFCGLKDIIIDLVNNSFNTNFSKEQNNEGLFTALKYISFTLFEQSHNIYGGDRDIIHKLNKLLYLSLKHKCFKNKKTLLKSIVDLVEVSTDKNILSTQHFYNLGNVNNLEYNNETFELVKMLTMKNYHMSMFNKIYETDKPYYFRSEVNSNFIFKDYNLDTEGIQRQITINNDYKNNLKSIQKNFTGFLRIIEKTIDKYKTLLNTTTKKKVLSNIYDTVKITTPYERGIIESCNCYKYICQYSIHDYDQFLKDIWFHDNYIILPKNIKKYTQFIKSKIKNITSFKSKVDKFINEISIDLKTTNYLNAIFKIKIFVRKRTFNNFLNHKSKTRNLLEDILIQKQVILTEELPTSQEVEEDIVSQLSALLDIDVPDKSKSKNVVKKEINKITKPSLLRFIDILDNYNTHSVITQKIDGITHRDIRLSNSFPIITHNYLFDIEYFEEDNMHFIIGLSKFKVYHETLFTQFMNNLRKQHPYTKGINIPEKISLKHLNNSDFKEILNQERENYKKYLSDSRTRKYKGKKLWWPKMFYEIEYNSLEEYIEILDFFGKNNYLKIFKNDGWIIQHKDYTQNEDTNLVTHVSFKLKPVELVTVDLMYKEDNLAGLRCWLYENKGELKDFEKNFNISVISNRSVMPENLKIYRCYPTIDKNKSLYKSNENVILNFEQREIRNDRKKPNSFDIVNRCVTNIKCPLNFENVNKILEKDIPYYTKQLPNQQSNRAKKYSSTTSKTLLPFIQGRTIDLGGGFKTKNYLKKFNESISECISTDCDLNIVAKNIIKSAKTKCEFEEKIKYSYLDFTKEFNDYSGIEKELHLHNQTQSYNTITLFNCINFALKTNNSIKQFFKNINRMSQINTNIIIKFMDADSFIEGIQTKLDDSIVLKSYYDSSFININFKDMTNRIYYEWAHAFPIEEKIIGRKELTNLFELHGWECVYYKHHEKYKNVIGKIDSLWERYFYSFSDIVFKYNGIN